LGQIVQGFVILRFKPSDGLENGTKVSVFRDRFTARCTLMKDIYGLNINLLNTECSQTSSNSSKKAAGRELL
jgi:hypothetical protein